MNYQKIKQLDAKRRFGKRALSFLLTEDSRKKLSGYFRKRSRKKLLARACEQNTSYLNDLFRTCLQHISPVTAPLALISRTDCFSGSYLSQLLDGHPELHAHPHEFTIDSLFKEMDPETTITDQPQHYFEIFFEEGTLNHINKENTAIGEGRDKAPFVFLPYLQKQIFIKYLKSKKIVKPSDLIEAYMTSYFGAWLNYCNLSQPKRFITAYAPQLTEDEKGLTFFFGVYPESRIIYTVSDPATWLLLAHNNDPANMDNVRATMSRWQAGIRLMLSSKKKFRDRVCFIRLNDLVGKTKTVMHILATFLGIQHNDILLTPTLNSYPISAETRFKMVTAAVNNSKPDDHLTLDQSTLKFIEELTKKDYQKILREVVRI